MLYRLLLIAALVYLGFKVFSWLSRNARLESAKRRTGSSGKDSVQTEARTSEMVQDPVCGLYLSANEAKSLTDRGVTVYFCSDRCLKRYLEGGR